MGSSNQGAPSKLLTAVTHSLISKLQVLLIFRNSKKSFCYIAVHHTLGCTHLNTGIMPTRGLWICRRCRRLLLMLDRQTGPTSRLRLLLRLEKRFVHLTCAAHLEVNPQIESHTDYYDYF
ncbi:hypothetical protein T10_3495 [Trichinella papuae]|uniref:Uncharacterized protein n=1 Tax=Trichinella papuae TaxID=268474 RepID=A0A0V1MBJ2_9BILA|nr:hypothetical protein T10_3495 [Trichinella papuae]